MDSIESSILDPETSLQENPIFVTGSGGCGQKRVIRVQNQILAVVFAVCFNSVLRVVRPC